MDGVDDALLKGFETEIEVYEALPYHPNIIVPPPPFIPVGLGLGLGFRVLDPFIPWFRV